MPAERETSTVSRTPLGQSRPDRLNGAGAAGGKALREDIDRLLHRRLYLEMVREDGSKQGRVTDTQHRQPTVSGA
jgi:hypothetical protein